jgi:hypothetical protein
MNLFPIFTGDDPHNKIFLSLEIILLPVLIIQTPPLVPPTRLAHMDQPYIPQVANTYYNRQRPSVFLKLILSWTMGAPSIVMSGDEGLVETTAVSLAIAKLKSIFSIGRL